MAEEPQEPQTAQIPVSEPITPAPTEPLPPAEAQAPSEPAQPVSEATPEPVPNEPLQTAQINPEEVEKAAQAASEPVPTPQPQTPASTSSPQATPPAPTTPSNKPNSRDLLAKGRAKVQEKKQKKLDKIVELLNTKDKVSNADVEKALRVSDATATRYLSALQKQGKIRKVGKTGRSVFYAKI